MSSVRVGGDIQAEVEAIGQVGTAAIRVQDNFIIIFHNKFDLRSDYAMSMSTS